jgi:hypothetical protein
LWFTLPFINIHDVPLLVKFSISGVNDDVLVFSVKSTLNFNYLIVFDVPDESSIESE